MQPMSFLLLHMMLLSEEGTAESGSVACGAVLDYLDDRQKRRDEDPFLIYYGFLIPMMCGMALLSF